MVVADARTQVRERLEGVLERFPGHLGIFETTYTIGDDRKIAVSLKAGHSVSYHGPEGMFVIHRSSNGDITFTSTHGFGNAEGISRQSGHLQGVNELPAPLDKMMQKLIDSRN